MEQSTNKKQVEVAVSYELVNTRTVELTLPKGALYFSKNDEGRFFPRGLVLFAIIPKYENSDRAYFLIEVSSNKQEFTDFVPLEDCRSSSWLKSTGLRKQAFDIFKAPSLLGDFVPVSKEYFESRSIELLTDYRRYGK